MRELDFMGVGPEHAGQVFTTLGGRPATNSEALSVGNLLQVIPGLAVDSQILERVAQSMRYTLIEFPGEYPLSATFSTGTEANIYVSVRRAPGTTSGGLEIKFTREEKGSGWAETEFYLDYDLSGRFRGAGLEHQVFVDGDIQYNGCSITEDGKVVLFEGPIFEREQEYFSGQFPVQMFLSRFVAQKTLDKPFSLHDLLEPDT